MLPSKKTLRQLTEQGGLEYYRVFERLKAEAKALRKAQAAAITDAKERAAAAEAARLAAGKAIDNLVNAHMRTAPTLPDDPDAGITVESEWAPIVPVHPGRSWDVYEELPRAPPAAEPKTPPRNR